MLLAGAAQARKIENPHDLREVPWAQNSALKSPLQWSFSDGKNTAKVAMKATDTTNGTQGAYASTLAGIG